MVKLRKIRIMIREGRGGEVEMMVMRMGRSRWDGVRIMRMGWG